ncbi:MAG TPA: hypothetical protein VIY86_12470, partial [Pirellulaceae bacterium]
MSHRWESFVIPSMHCPEEFAAIRLALGKLQGVTELRPDYLSRALQVRVEGDPPSRQILEQALVGAGFPPG